MHSLQYGCLRGNLLNRAQNQIAVSRDEVECCFVKLILFLKVFKATYIKPQGSGVRNNTTKQG